MLASNTNVLHAGHFKTQFADVLRHFDALGTSYEAGARKPHPDFYAHCVRLAGVPKSAREPAIPTDSWHRDVARRQCRSCFWTIVRVIR